MDELIMAAGRKKAEKQIAQAGVFSMADLELKREYYRTGIPQIDNNLGGIPKSCIGHIASKQGVGKTTFVCEMCISALRFLPENMKVAFCDFEGRLQKSMIFKMLSFYGVSSERFLINAPLDGESGLATIEQWLFDRDDIALVIGDSLKAVITNKSIEKDIHENAAAMGNANLVNKFLEKILNKMPTQETSLLWIDHLKAVASSSMFKTSDTKSGDSIKFYTSWRIDLGKGSAGKISRVVKGVEEIQGHHLNLRVVKTTVSPMAIIQNMPFKFEAGVQVISYIFKDAIDHGLVQKSYQGAVYIRENGDSVLIGKTKGERNKWATLHKDDLLFEIEERLYQINKKIFDTKMNKCFEFEDAEFNF
jgi:RecA/RadA recombinase